MQVTAVKTERVGPKSSQLLELIDTSITSLVEKSVLIITSKIVSLCEGSVVERGVVEKEVLIAQQSQYYLPSEQSKYGHHFTVAGNTLISMAGIDESNGAGRYVLWPANPQQVANDVRRHLSERFGLECVGVIITDSTSQPLRRGTVGVALAHSGLAAVRNYVGQPDLFERPYGAEHANVAGGLAAAAVVVMGEGNEQTPLAIISDIPFVEFAAENPSPDELNSYYIRLEDDLFAPFLQSAPWVRGEKPLL